MKLKGKLLSGLLALTTANFMLPPTADGAPPLNIGAPVTVQATPEGLNDNGDGRFVSWNVTNKGYEFKLYDSEFNVIKEFTLNVMVSVGTPTSVTVVKGAEETSSYFLTDRLFNSDDLYEVLFTSGDLYNERGQFLGVLNGNYVYVPDADNIYVGGSNIIEEVEESQVWIDKYNASLPVWLKETMSLIDGTVLHSDFGAPAIGMMADAAGTDVVGGSDGYNWFISPQDYELHNSLTALSNVMPYLFGYLTIDRCNHLIKNLKGQEASATKATILANAYAIRAWSYMALAQRFQFTYYGNESKPCVPLVDEFNTSDLSTTGVERATVRDTYAFILADLDRAIELLGGNSTEAETISPDAPKMMVSIAAAYGLRARANLIMHRYPEAEADARKAIAEFDGRPYMISEIHPGGFTNLNDDSWMWGLRYTENETVGLVNFQSFMSPFCAGYSGVSPRRINMSLFNQIPATDVRRGLFLDENSQSSALAEHQYTVVRMPYVSVKFGAERDLDSWTAIGRPVDYPLMRVEEMYYIVAEALAMNGNTDMARSYLLAFVNEHRDPAYTLSAGITPSQLRDEIWRQRRIEFWGEGLSFYDLMRLAKGVNRIGGGYPERHVYNIAPDDNLLLLRFPSRTTEFVNAALTEANNNPEATPPTVYSEEGEMLPDVDYAYWYDEGNTWNYYGDYIEYTPKPSDLHDGWEMITTSPNGIGTITIHYDPVTGKVEVPLQKIPEFSNDYIADSYTYFNTEEYADASRATKRNGRGYDMKLDLVRFQYEGDVAVHQHRRKVWIGEQPSPIVTTASENPMQTFGYYFTEAETETITVSMSVPEGYKLYLDILPIEESYWENLLKLTPYTGETQISRTLDKGRHALLYMMYDEEGNLRRTGSSELIIAPLRFKDTMEEYGEWTEWKNISGCQYQFGGLINGSLNGDCLIRRNAEYPSLVNIRLLTSTDPLFNGVDRDIIIDLDTSLASIPRQDTGIQLDGYESVYVADSYTFLKSLYYITENKLYDDTLLGLHVIYEVSDGENLNSLEGTELLRLPAPISYILSEEYHSTPATMASEAASLKLNQNIKPTRK